MKFDDDFEINSKSIKGLIEKKIASESQFGWIGLKFAGIILKKKKVRKLNHELTQY